MTKLDWSNHSYETGVSHGVFYPESGPGVAWNGLVSVAESGTDSNTVDTFVDGVKVQSTVIPKDYQAKVTAFSVPKEFLDCVGIKTIIVGVQLTDQPGARFSFSYRTEKDQGYRLHLVYNVLPTLDETERSSLSDSPAPEPISFQIDPAPMAISGFRSTSHFIVDSTRVSSTLLSALEAILYGTDLLEPAFPTIDTLLTMFSGG